jgi:START domain-containing protein
MLRVFLCLLCLSAADEPWKRYSEKNGVVVERRAVAGSKYFEHRASVSVAEAPAVVERTIWSGVTESPPKTVKKRTVLVHNDNEFVVYDELKTPVVSDRDAVIRIRRSPGEIRFETTDQLGPPPNSHYVRLPVVRGAWTIVPDGSGSRLLYSCYSEPGGAIPAWMVRGAQADQIFADVQRIVDRLTMIK